MACADRCENCVYFDRMRSIGYCHANPPMLSVDEDGDSLSWRPVVGHDDLACRHFQYRTGSEDE